MFFISSESALTVTLAIISSSNFERNSSIASPLPSAALPIKSKLFLINFPDSSEPSIFNRSPTASYVPCKASIYSTLVSLLFCRTLFQSSKFSPKDSTPLFIRRICFAKSAAASASVANPSDNSSDSFAISIIYLA
nr:MAG TPA: hypothetical protein [Caudoviricetes sp.]